MFPILCPIYNGLLFKRLFRHLPLIIPEELDVDVDMATQTTFMVMDEYPTTLQTFIKTRKHVHPQPPYGIPTQYFSLCLYQVLSAISHLHNNHAIHRDIKAENVFLDSHLRVVLADFGFARKIRNPNGSPVELVAKEQIVAGNNGAWAPELIRARRADNDIFTSVSYLFELENVLKCLFVCLFGFNVAFKHLRSYRDGACL